MRAVGTRIGCSHAYSADPTWLGSGSAGPAQSEIRCGIQNEPPAGGITAWIDYGSRTQKATFYGTIVGDKEVWPAPPSRRRCMGRRCVFSLTASMPKRTQVDRRARAPRRKVKTITPVAELADPPPWIKPQFTRLVDEAPLGETGCTKSNTTATACTHESMAPDPTAHQHWPDWSHRYKRIIEALRSLKVKSPYLDGELCALNAGGVIRSRSKMRRAQ